MLLVFSVVLCKDIFVQFLIETVYNTAFGELIFLYCFQNLVAGIVGFLLPSINGVFLKLKLLE